ncbi:dihydrolipoyllysine-residue succinyltransferase component of 2-oxoglutarate dehydrogenase complex [Flocculibacter collagenilyticus]|uniref:hypothetical protein n=1 Tax=Flocculibacter collagenilyticus TaxID=2744479 RepID=UPI0018F749C4|nr:hypothetical protein [Flocculibacter collagenilyticus]
MEFNKTLKSSFIAIGVLSVGLVSSFVSAASISLQYDVKQKEEGYVQFELIAKNISNTTLYDVEVATPNGLTNTVNYGDLEVGQSASELVTLSWQANDEPPTLTWSITFMDQNGATVTESK